MVSPPRRRIHIWKVLGVVVGGFLFVALAFWIWVKSIEARKSEQMRLRMDELRAGWGRCDARSRVPRGEAIPGEAWADYANALTSAWMTPDEEKAVRAFVITEATSDLAVVRKAVAAHMNALESMARGVRKSDIGTWGTLPPTGRSTFDAYYTHLSLLTVAHSRLLLADGKPGEAVAPLLDYSRMMLDFVEANPQLAYLAWPNLAIPFHDLTVMSCSAPLARSELADLEHGLDVLDRGFPCYFRGLPGQLRSMGEEFQDPESDVKSLTGEEGSLVQWRFAFSPGLVKLDAFFHYDAQVRELMRLHEGSYGSLDEAYLSYESCDESSKNPIVRGRSIANRYFGQIARERHAQLRLARMAARYRASGVILELADPLGSRMLHEARDGKTIFWSRGCDSYMNPRPGGWKTFKDPSYLRLEVAR